MLLLVSSALGATYGSLSIESFDGSGTHGLVADARTIDNMFWNPASLGYSARSGAFAALTNYLVAVRIYSIGCQVSYGGKGFGLFVNALRSGDLTRTTGDDPGGGLGETFTYSETTLGLSSGWRWSRFVSFGTTYKMISRQCDGDAEFFAFSDMSLMSSVKIGAWQYSAALCAQNMPMLYYPDSDENGEGNNGYTNGGVEIGLAGVNPDKGIGIGMSHRWSEGRRKEIRFGTSLEPSQDFRFSLGLRKRIGHFSDASQNLSWHRGLWAAFSVRFGRCWLGYAFEDFSPLDNVHHFTLSFELAQGVASRFVRKFFEG